MSRVSLVFLSVCLRECGRVSIVAVVFLRILSLFVVLPAFGIAAEGDAAKEARFLKNTRQLIYEGKRSGEGYFSPDGKRLIFQSEREPGNPFYQIYILDLETGDSRRVSPGIGKTTCSFFQPGTDRVIFASTHEDPEAAEKTSMSSFRFPARRGANHPSPNRGCRSGKMDFPDRARSGKLAASHPAKSIPPRCAFPRR